MEKNPTRKESSYCNLELDELIKNSVEVGALPGTQELFFTPNLVEPVSPEVLYSKVIHYDWLNICD